MKKLDEIKAFIEKNAAVMAELAQAAEYSSYSSLVSDEIIEQQQDLKRHANRLQILSVDKPIFEDAEFRVLIGIDEFCSFINLEDCKTAVNASEDKVAYRYSIVIDNILLTGIKIVPNEEHKKAQAI